MIPIPSYESDSAPFLEMGIMEEQGPYSHVASRAMWEAPSREDFPPAPAGEAPGAPRGLSLLSPCAKCRWDSQHLPLSSWEAGFGRTDGTRLSPRGTCMGRPSFRLLPLPACFISLNLRVPRPKV